MSLILSIPSKNTVAATKLVSISPNDIRKRELPVKAYYLVTSQKVTIGDHKMTSLMGFKHNKSFLSLLEVELGSFFSRSDSTSPQLSPGWPWQLTSSFSASSLSYSYRVYKDVNHFVHSRHIGEKAISISCYYSQNLWSSEIQPQFYNVPNSENNSVNSL